MSNSLIKALPMRWTCVMCFESRGSSPGCLPNALERGRDVVPQTPITASGLAAASIWPLRMRHGIGTSIAMALTLYPETKSLAKF